MGACDQLSENVGKAKACRAFGVPRCSLYRWLSPPSEPKPRQRPPWSLSDTEEQAVKDVLHSKRFVDQAPREVWAQLLDSKRYLCSVSTMYRILRRSGEIRERRDQLRHPTYSKPELLATAPNQVWSWDITKLLGPTKWTYYYLYVILDIFSRYT